MNEDIEQFPISLELLRVMFSFVELLGKPNATTISENNFYHLEWDLKNNTSIVLRFRTELEVDYVILKPSANPTIMFKRDIINGLMSPTKLIQYLKDNIGY